MSSPTVLRGDGRAASTRGEEGKDKADSHMLLYTFILLAVCINCYFNSLQDGFCFDDAKAIVHNYDLRPTVPVYEIFQNDFWGTPMHKDTSHKSYRPLCILTFRWNYAIHELDPAGYHFGNMMLHWALCVLIMYTFKMFLTEWMSFILAVLFMVHPVHTEAVTGVVGRAETLCAIFMLLALKSYERGSGYRRKTEWKPIFLTVLLVVIATLCKEQGITAVAVCCSYEVLWLQRVTLWEGLDLARLLIFKPSKLPDWFVSSLKRMCFLLFTTFGLMALRILVMGAQLPFFTTFDNPPAVAPTPARQLTQWYLLPVNTWLLLYPFPLLCDYSMGTIPLLESFSDPRNLATMNFVTILGVLTFYALTDNTRTSRQVCMALAFMVFPFLPATNLFFPVGFVVAERILYIPSLGFSMLVVIGLQKLLQYDRFKKLIYAVLIITVVFHAAKTARRNIDWKSERTLFLSGLQLTRDNAKIWNNVGHSYEREKKPEIAMLYFDQARLSQPDDGGAWINLGRAYQALGKDEEAIDSYRKAELLMPPKIPGRPRRLDPKFLSIYVSMATILRKDPTRHQEALGLLKKAISMWSEYVDAYVNMGDLLVENDRLDDAERVLRKLLEFAPRNVDGLYNLGVIAYKRNDTAAAKEWFERCLHFNPKHPRALYSLTALSDSLDSGGVPNEEVIERLHTLLEVDNENPQLFTKLGLLYKQKVDLENAEKYLAKALEINSSYSIALYNIGQVYHQLEDHNRALLHLEKYVEKRKNNINAWVLLGDLYVSYRKDFDAGWKAFEAAQDLDPGNAQVAHNFCVIMVKKQEYQEGKKCLEELLEWSDEGFIRENLAKLNALIDQKRDAAPVKLGDDLP